MFINDVAMWCMTFGESSLELKVIPLNVLNQTTLSSNCERNWSLWSLVHVKTRNRLKYNRLYMVVYLRHNMKLKIRHLRRHQIVRLVLAKIHILITYLMKIIN